MKRNESLITALETLAMQTEDEYALSNVEQLSHEAVVPASYRFGVNKQDVVLMALPDTNSLWIALLDKSITRKVPLTVVPTTKDAAFIAQIIKDEGATVLAVTPRLWPNIFQVLKAYPENINPLRIIIANGKDAPVIRCRLIPGAISKSAMQEYLAPDLFPFKEYKSMRIEVSIVSPGTFWIDDIKIEKKM